MGNVRVRFAPSPTGFLHVGGARTAIFNWLFAKNQNGKFLLRIEDTDPERSKSELSQQIIRSLDWLNIFSDEPVVYQSDRIERYRQIIMELVKNKRAYYCFETTEELDSKRKEAESKKIYYKYDRASLKLTPEFINQYLSDGKEFTIRFFVPEGIVSFNDVIHGETKFNNSEIDDFVILRSDGSPVYHISVVVDDHDMNISHVIRGDDHLSNTPKQILLYDALGWNIPEFVHLPLILDEEKKKLSKRRNTVAIEEYNEKGYLPDALFNFLTLLGFAPPDNKEIMPRGELIKAFSLEKINKKSAVFDIKKLNWINTEYIKMSDENEIAKILTEKLKNILPDEKIHGFSLSYVRSVVHLLKERVPTINQFTEYGKYFFIEPDSYEAKGLAKYWNNESKELLVEYLSILKNSTTRFDAIELENSLRTFAEYKKVKASIIIHCLRLALTGITISPGIFDLMEVLNKEKVINRIKVFIISADKNLK